VEHAHVMANRTFLVTEQTASVEIIGVEPV
jgi:hypothetical protein